MHFRSMIGRRDVGVLPFDGPPEDDIVVQVHYDVREWALVIALAATVVGDILSIDVDLSNI